MSRPPKQRITVGDVSWKEAGNCSENPLATTELYAVFERDQIEAARTWCATCPVREACLRYALANDEPFGVWGGMTEKRRRQYARHRQPLAS
jgi:WhiB family transcriptional regulator, redox-sensing transcriptional regulator